VLLLVRPLQTIVESANWLGKNLQYHKKTKKMRLRFLSAKAAKCHAQCLPFCQFVIRTGRIYMCNLYHDCCILVS
jgi:hypothetical protein